jgi:hypothetical protein
MSILPHPPPADYAEQLRAAVVEAEEHAAAKPGSEAARFYAMGLRLAAGLYGLVEGFDPATRAGRLADLERIGIVPAFTADGAPNPAAVGSPPEPAAEPERCGATNNHPCATNGGRGPSLLGGQHSCERNPHADSPHWHRCVCGEYFCTCTECRDGHV